MANPFDEIDPKGGNVAKPAAAPTVATSNPFDSIDPKGGMAAAPAAEPATAEAADTRDTDPMTGLRIGADTERTAPEAFPNKVARAAIQYAAGIPKAMTEIPQQAFESAKKYTETGEYDPAPVMGAAMLTMGTGAGARGGVRPVAPAAPEAMRPAPTPPQAQPPPLPPEVSAIPRQVDRPGADVGLIQPDVPHELPQAHSRALSAAGNGGPLSGVSPDTIAFLRQRMEAEGFTPHTIDQRLSEMSSHHFFGEIGPSLEADFGAMSRPQGPGKQEIWGSIRQRDIEARDRTRHGLDRAFGPDENVAQLQRSMEADRAIAADPLYREFRNTEVSPTPAIDAIMPRLQASGALRAANEALAIEGIPSTRGFLEMKGHDVDAAQVPTAAAFQYAKEHIDRRIQKAITDGDGPGARRFTQLHNDLVAALDNHPLVGDTWRRARETFAQPSEIMDAMNTGRRVLTGHIPANDLPFMTAAYSQPQMRALRVGMRDYLENMLGKRDNLTAETVNTILSPNNAQKMRWAIGDEATETLVAAVEHERHMRGTQTRIHGGSPTQGRAVADKLWTVQDENPGMTLGDVGNFFKHPVRSAVGHGAEAAERFGVGRRRAAAEERMARIREEASRIYTLQGPERDAVARYLVEGLGMPPGRAAGGAVNHNHNPSEAQKKAGNYAKTHKFFQGLDITIENLKGKPRTGIGRDGKKWSVSMPAHYGYIKRTEGADGDHVDVYLGPNEKSDQVFVVDQKDAETGKFDEHKCMLGFDNEADARRTYRAGFSDGKDRIKHMRRMSMAEFRQWLDKGDIGKQIKHYATGGAVKRALQSLKEYADGGEISGVGLRS